MSLGGFLARGSQRDRGRSAERDGAAWLEQQGFRIIECNVSYRFGELDLVALDGATLCFIEIKARRSDRFGAPAEAVTLAKRRRLTRSARAYLAKKPHDGPCRFDVLGMRAEGSGWRFEFVKDAFSATS